MKKCINTAETCLGRDCQDFTHAELCCKEEIQEEIAIAQNIVDAISDCTRNKESLQQISSKLSYAAQVINKNEEEERIEVFPIIRRFSVLIYEFQEKILHDSTIAELTCSFSNELQRWFTQHFLSGTDHSLMPVQRQSIIADINTIEMALGVCMIEDHSESLDDLFF